MALRAGKMVEKNVSLPLLTKTPKSKLTTEQTLTKKNAWTYQKRYPTSEDKEEATRQEEGHNRDKIKSHPCWVGNPQTGKQLYHSSSPTGVKVLSPTSGFPAWESGNGRRSPQRIWLWRPSGFGCRSSTGLRETETPLLEGAHKVTWAPGPRGKSSDLLRDWDRPTC